eukprot:TRINITY_DN7362_c0_g1_i1.p1 TRINITY_DN7362_c0_g1~~TRINITY_DN7362_c0_g1_i1.p1  ORF type:complete len:337 (+),score=31.21 TRINITY_DN7362_c0_g1_i1:31-1041(+)
MSLLYPDLGEVCLAPGCGEYDLLASQCKYCSAVTCSSHMAPEAHRCRGLKDTGTCAKCRERFSLSEFHECKEVTIVETTQCMVEGCTAHDAVSVLCEDCGRKHCVSHRHPQDHPCVNIDVSGNTKSSESNELSPTEAVQPFYTWRYANDLTKLDTNNISIESRVGLRVHYTVGLLARPRYVVVNKRWTVGKVLDFACKAGQVTNSNNMSLETDKKLRLFLLWGTCPELPLSSSVGSLISDFFGFRMGAGVMVHCGPSLPREVVYSVPRWIMSLKLKDITQQGLQSKAQEGSWLDKLDEGPSLLKTVYDRWRNTSTPVFVYVCYILFLLFIGWADFY